MDTLSRRAALPRSQRASSPCLQREAAEDEHPASHEKIGEQQAVHDGVLVARGEVAGRERFDYTDAQTAEHRDAGRAEVAEDGADEAFQAIRNASVPIGEHDG